jgi:cardiolipin synthase
VDGSIGFTGGVGIADMWTGSAQDEHHWRETHSRITGPACASLHAGFAENWLEATREELTAPTPTATGKIAVQTIISTAGQRPTAAEKLLMTVFAAARHRLWITTGYFVPSDPVIAALAAAARRDVDVRVLTNGRFTDHGVTLRAGRSSYEQLLNGGVKIYEYDRTMHHAKIITADSSWATLGSINLDTRSLVLNDELNVAVTDPAIISSLDLQFLEDLKHSKHIRSSHWQQRGRLAKIAESGSSVFRRQL